MKFDKRKVALVVLVVSVVALEVALVAVISPFACVPSLELCPSSDIYRASIVSLEYVRDESTNPPRWRLDVVLDYFGNSSCPSNTTARISSPGQSLEVFQAQSPWTPGMVRWVLAPHDASYCTVDSDELISWGTVIFAVTVATGALVLVGVMKAVCILARRTRPDPSESATLTV